MTRPAPHPDEVDPFALPDWLGDAAVTWVPDAGIGTGPVVAGRLHAEGHETLPCDLLAVDEAYPAPVADDDTRTHAHQAWRHGQVLLAAFEERLTLVVPGREFTADRVLEALGRLARAVGADPARYAALLRIGGTRAQ